MTIRERIQRIANKANVSYSTINILVNNFYGKNFINLEDKLNLLEKQYGIQ